MRGQRIGYVRVSSLDQNPERQLEQVSVGKVFTDRASGKDMRRPQLDALLDFVREGDTVVVHSMDRSTRALDDLRKLVQRLTKKGARNRIRKGRPCSRSRQLTYDAASPQAKRKRSSRAFGISRETLYQYLKETDTQQTETAALQISIKYCKFK